MKYLISVLEVGRWVLELTTDNYLDNSPGTLRRHTGGRPGRIIISGVDFTNVWCHSELWGHLRCWGRGAVAGIRHQVELMRIFVSIYFSTQRIINISVGCFS